MFLVAEPVCWKLDITTSSWCRHRTDAFFGTHQSRLNTPGLECLVADEFAGGKGAVSLPRRKSAPAPSCTARGLALHVGEIYDNG